jgi:hypothetical protein
LYKHFSKCDLGREDPTSGTLKMSSAYYFKGDCNDMEVQAKLKENYIKVVSDENNFPRSFCQKEKHCKLENIQVFCGAVDASRRRRRRRRGIEMEVSLYVLLLFNRKKFCCHLPLMKNCTRVLRSETP